MKVILLLALLSLTFCTDCDDMLKADSYKDCKDLTVEAGNFCCYVEFEGEVMGVSGEYGYCEELTPEQQKDLDKTEKEMNAAYEGLGDVSYSIDCNSNYLSMAFLALLFILF